jgi:hypothetical protein
MEDIKDIKEIYGIDGTSLPLYLFTCCILYKLYNYLTISKGKGKGKGKGS